MLEKLLEDEETQVHGIAIFERMEDFTFMKMIRFTQSDLARKGDGLKILQVRMLAKLLCMSSAGECAQLAV